MTAAPPAPARAPTPDERRQERALLTPMLCDVVITVLLVGFGLFTASLTLLGEGIRSLIMIAASIYAFMVLRAVHRSRLGHFEFGIGKLEQFVTMVVALALIVSALWVARSGIERVAGPAEIATPFGLALAAVINAINALINTLGLVGMVGASGAGEGKVYRAQVAARAVMMASSLFLVLTLTAAALARDAGIALILDLVGAAFVVCVMLFNGFTMLARALPEILDAPPARAMAARLGRVVANTVPPDTLAGVRARQASGTVLAEIALRKAPPPATLHDHHTAIGDALAREGIAVDIALILQPDRLRR
ncbi:MAG: hypothetical protein AcusKO_03470 [Acuticoccus sp.]